MSILQYATHLFLAAFWRHPLRLLAGGALFCLLGIAFRVGTARLRLARRSLEQERPRSSPFSFQAFPQTGFWLLAIVLICSLADWALLWALPHLRLSFASGTEILPPVMASVLARLLLLWGLSVARFIAEAGTLARQQPSGPIPQARIRPTVLAFLTINLAFSLVQIDAYVLEPQWVQTTEQSLSFNRLDPNAPPIRVVHLTDTHIERYSYREATIVRRVNALKPDLIVLTGDYLNISHLSDPTSAAHFRRFVSQLEAPYGIYAVRGTVEPSLESMEWLVQGTNVVWLEQETKTIEIRGQQISLVGVACSHDLDVDTARLDQALIERPENTFSLLLYHSPDLIEQVAEREIDLYLSGHTHGGQLRLPFLGPIVTGSAYGRQYVAGLFEAPTNMRESGQNENTWMYNSRGLGLEGSAMPRARFLCRPEIVSLELDGR